MNWDTFWTVMLVMLVWIPLLLIWSFSLVDLFMRSDLSGWAKALWLLVIVFFPIVGTLIYNIFRPVFVSGPRRSDVAMTSDRLSTLSDLHQQGIISQEEYDRGRATILSV